jgi:DNA-directed RNA polymerase subunit H
MVKFEILKHELVPECYILSKEDVEKLRSNYGIRKEDLPWIRRSDPVCKEKGAKPGEVLKIIRKSKVSGHVEAYRYCVPG